MQHWEGLQNGKYQAMLGHGVDLLHGEALAQHANGVLSCELLREELMRQYKEAGLRKNMKPMPMNVIWKKREINIKEALMA